MSDSRVGITDHVNKDECGERIEGEGTFNESYEKCFGPGKEEEEANSDDLISRSIDKDKDFEIERNLVSLQIILGNLVRNVELVKASHSQLCELVNLETPDIEPTSILRGQESPNFKKIVGESCCASNINHLRDDEYEETIEEEGSLKENANNVLELEDIEGADSDNLSSWSTNKDYKIEKNLLNMNNVLEDLKKNVELVKARHSYICELVNLKMFHTS